jgi:hypothetical protein
MLYGKMPFGTREDSRYEVLNQKWRSHTSNKNQRFTGVFTGKKKKIPLDILFFMYNTKRMPIV